MDKFKEKTMKDYTAWDIDCKYNTKSYDRRNQRIKRIFKRKARRNLKRELKKQKWRINNMEMINLIAGKLQSSTQVRYWKLGYGQRIDIGDYAIVENANGYDLVEIVGILVTSKNKASIISNTNYNNMKNVKKVIQKNELCEETEHEKEERV